MTRQVIRRLATVIPLLIILLFGVTVLMDLSPSDPARLAAGEAASEQDVERISAALGLDRPVTERFADYLGSVLNGDLGSSMFTGRPVLEAIKTSLPITLWLTGLALLLALVIALPLGVIAALKRGGFADRVVTIVSSTAMAVPPFALGLALVTVFAVNRSWFPAGGYSPPSDGLGDWLRSLALPALALAVDPAAEFVRQTRGAVADTVSRDYTQTAIAMGLPKRVVFGRYVLKNSAIPIVTVFGLQAARVFGGAAVIEVIFSIPGLGSEALNAALYHDYPMIQGIILISGALIILVNVLVDLSYSLFDPRLRS